MYNFFIEDEQQFDDEYCITGADFNHIKNVLRFKDGDKLLVSQNGKTHLCQIKNFTDESVVCTVLEKDYCNMELPVTLALFQGLPKGDKLELIIQKTVELGVHHVYPVEMKRSVVKIEEKKKASKRERWQAIAEAGAKQSKRNVIPTVHEPISYKKAMELFKDFDLVIVPYENKDGMQSTYKLLKDIKKGYKIAILIGPEGGFEDFEIDLALNAGGQTCSLGNRILRTETAAICAVSMCMLYTETVFENKPQ